MFIPFFTSSSRRASRQSWLERRKGGGGGGSASKGSSSSSKSGTSKSSGSSSSSSKSSGSSSSSSSKSKPKSKPIKIGGSSKSASPSSSGGGSASVIGAGALFAGRSQGGGARSQIFGSKTYGSGYPGYAGRGVSGRPFPFYFWPLAWGGAAGYGGAYYLHNDEYGRSDNSSRPGGSMTFAIFPSNYTSSDANQTTTFRILADNETTSDLIDDLYEECGSHLPQWTYIQQPQAYTGDVSQWPRPEQVIQYYRASSISLTLDGYNNSAVYGSEGIEDTTLPGGIDTFLLECMNRTIGEEAPLVDAADGMVYSGASSWRLRVSSSDFSLILWGWCMLWWLLS